MEKYLPVKLQEEQKIIFGH